MLTFAQLTYGQSVVVDTSVWVSSLLANDRNHVQASTWLNNHFMSNGLVVASLLLVVEAGAAVVRATQDTALAHNIVSQLQVLPAVRLAILDQQLIAEAANIAITYRIRGADSIYVALAAQLGLPLVTFDHEQLTLPTSIITTIRP